MDKQQEAHSDSMSTITVKEYPPSEVYGSEPPPVRIYEAYQKPRSSAVQIARIAAFTVVAVSFVLGSFILAAAWVQTNSSCQQTQEHEHLVQPAALVQISIEDDPQFGSDVGHGGSCASTDDTLDGSEENEVNSNHLEDSLESEESSDHESQEVTEPPPGPDDQATTGEHVPIKFKVPLTLDFDELAGMLVEKNQRSRMNCVVEKRRAEEIVDHQPRTVKLPFGLNVTTDPRYEHVSGEKMAIFCESGNDQRHAPMEVMHGPIMIPLPGPVHLPLQFQGHPHRMHHQQQLPHPEIRAHPQHMQQLPLADMRVHLQHMQQLPVSDMRAPPQHMQQQPLSDMRPPPQQMHQLPLPDMRPPPQQMQQMPLPEIHAHPQRMQQVSIPVAFPAHQPAVPMHTAIHITDGQEQQLQAEEAREQQMHIPIHIQESREGRQFPHPLMAMQDGRQGRAFQHQHMQQIPIEVTEVKEGRPFPQQQHQRFQMMHQIPVEVLEVHEGRGFHQLPVPENSRAFQRPPVPMMQQQEQQQEIRIEEPRPHYVQPRSVRSVDDVLHRREKRMRRCACDCAC